MSESYMNTLDQLSDKPKINRRCPRCRERFYHFLLRFIRKGIWRAKCANCGNEFKVRPTIIELGLEKLRIRRARTTKGG